MNDITKINNEETIDIEGKCFVIVNLSSQDIKTISAALKPILQQENAYNETGKREHELASESFASIMPKVGNNNINYRQENENGPFSFFITQQDLSQQSLEIYKTLFEKQSPYIAKVYAYHRPLKQQPKQDNHIIEVVEDFTNGNLTSYSQKSYQRNTGNDIRPDLANIEQHLANITHILSNYIEMIDALAKDQILYTDIKTDNILIREDNSIGFSDYKSFLPLSKLENIESRAVSTTPFYEPSDLTEIKGSDIFTTNNFKRLQAYQLGCLFYQSLRGLSNEDIAEITKNQSFTFDDPIFKTTDGEALQAAINTLIQTKSWNSNEDNIGAARQVIASLKVNLKDQKTEILLARSPDKIIENLSATTPFFHWLIEKVKKPLIFNFNSLNKDQNKILSEFFEALVKNNEHNQDKDLAYKQMQGYLILNQLWSLSGEAISQDFFERLQKITKELENRASDTIICTNFSDSSSSFSSSSSVNVSDSSSSSSSSNYSSDFDPDNTNDFSDSSNNSINPIVSVFSELNAYWETVYDNSILSALDRKQNTTENITHQELKQYVSQDNNKTDKKLNPEFFNLTLKFKPINTEDFGNSNIVLDTDKEKRAFFFNPEIKLIKVRTEAKPKSLVFNANALNNDTEKKRIMRYEQQTLVQNDGNIILADPIVKIGTLKSQHSSKAKVLKAQHSSFFKPVVAMSCIATGIAFAILAVVAIHAIPLAFLASGAAASLLKTGISLLEEEVAHDNIAKPKLADNSRVIEHESKQTPTENISQKNISQRSLGA